MSVVIIDYGSGNLRSAAKALERAAREANYAGEVSVTSEPDAVRRAERIVLPGVGAFADCRRGLQAIAGMEDALTEAAIARGKPFLGICVGMQLMATLGLEHGEHKGLGWIPGRVIPLAPKSDDAGPGGTGYRIPHMGWNELEIRAPHPVLDQIAKRPAERRHAYFVHSYHFAADNPAHVLATVSYGETLSAVIGRDNLIGTQFHPEKSQDLGLAFIAAFFGVDAMILFPAIDLKDGRCVRLVKGDMGQVTVFNDSPADQAHRFVAAGAEWIHVVDLNGAFAGKPVNRSAVEGILAAAGVPIQLGGGIRDIATIEAWLAAGVARVILGTAAVKDPELVRSAARAFPGKIAVGIDARGGYVATEGWAETSHLDVADLARRFVDAGVAAIIHTDIDRDGLLAGANVAASAALARTVPIPVIVSGGVSSLDDLKAVKAEEASGLAGVISGRAIYDGRLDLAAGVALLKARPI